MTVLGKGRAEAISARDIAQLADQLGCHPADLEAIAEVESNGFGWFADGRMKILFEKHWFYRNLTGSKRALAVKTGLARNAWIVTVIDCILTLSPRPRTSVRKKASTMLLASVSSKAPASSAHTVPLAIFARSQGKRNRKARAGDASFTCST